MLFLPRKNSLTSLFKEVTGFSREGWSGWEQTVGGSAGPLPGLVPHPEQANHTEEEIGGVRQALGFF